MPLSGHRRCWQKVYEPTCECLTDYVMDTRFTANKHTLIWKARLTNVPADAAPTKIAIVFSERDFKC